jgi:hypothetical protein
MMVFNPGAMIGLAVAMALGFGVGPLVKMVGDSLPIESPTPDLEPYWAKLRDMKGAGLWIGIIERPIFFAALWIPNGWPILSSWLVFKLAYYWQGANFTAYPIDTPSKEQAAYMVAKRQIGTHHVATSLIGTGLDILIAFIGVAVGNSIVWN